jgi:hypothetical protein
MDWIYVLQSTYLGQFVEIILSASIVVCVELVLTSKVQVLKNSSPIPFLVFQNFQDSQTLALSLLPSQTLIWGDNFFHVVYNSFGTPFFGFPKIFKILKLWR